ncbi:hypothetical protein F4604DRAFT_1741788 [Suillus subluteus]|nr:hypothetical protein F4604DRAFT_1741788 [Suillus subluteus]
MYAVPLKGELYICFICFLIYFTRSISSPCFFFRMPFLRVLFYELSESAEMLVRRLFLWVSCCLTAESASLRDKSI